MRIKSSGGVFTAKKLLTFSRLATIDPSRDIMAQTTPLKRCLTLDSIGLQSTKMPTTWSSLVMLVNIKERFRNEMKCLKIPSKFAKFLTFEASISWGRSRLHEGTNTYSRPSITCRNWLKRKRSPPMMLKKFQLNELNELRYQAYENSLIHKEKTKRLHDSKIKDNIFNVGNRVLLFNSRLKIFLGKLKTRWSGPFTITHVFPYGTVELSQTDRLNFKVNGHRLKHYFGEDITKMVIPDHQTSPRTNECRDWVKLSDPKQALRRRHPMLILVDFVLQSSLPQLHLGIIYPNLID
nr:reverse transcriptase domain-containing protein [Tanacetum cinerariifolium]